MINTHPPTYYPRRSQRGYTVIIVLLILTILAILAITLSYTTRLEVVSAANYTSGIQARTAARTGVAVMSAKLSPLTSVEAPTKAANRGFWSSPRDVEVTADIINTRSGERGQLQLDMDVPPVADLYAEDTSALLNLNTATEEQLTLVFQAALNKKGLSYSQAPGLARALAKWRLGPNQKPGVAGVDDDTDAGLVSLARLTSSRSINPASASQAAKQEIARQLQAAMKEGDSFDNDRDGAIDEPGEQIDEPDEYIADIRRPAYGDDRRVYLLSDLNYVTGFTPEIIDAIKPFVTTFSESKDVFISRGNTEQPRLNVNYAELDELYDALVALYPDRDPELLAQFVVNLADYRDADSIPTVHEFTLNGRRTEVFGFEMTPYINEVWPDSASSDDEEDDDGQYVEIFNPWPVAINVDGWRVKTASSDVILKGVIAPRGFIIITDDLDDSNDDSPEDDKDRQFGSFYRIFGLVPNSTNFRMVEHSTFDLPNNKDTVKLLDREGNLIDQFEYATNGSEPFKYSWQREDPRLRAGRMDNCSPYMINKGFAQLAGEFELDEQRDQLFHSLAHVLNVPASYVRRDTSGRDYAVTGRYPLLEKAAGAGHLDWRLLDIFTIESDLPGKAPWLDDEWMTPLAKPRKEAAPRPPAPTLLGLVNVNTASPDMLAFLFGIDFERLLVNDQAGVASYQYRYAAQNGSGERGMRFVRRAIFPNRSDFFAAALKPELERGSDRQAIVKTLEQIMPHITLGSMSYSVLSQNRMITDQAGERSQARSLMKALVSLNEDGQIQIINWHFVH